ncbi:iron complex transport system substrate-binding protein [Dysgonomonadaceae bacterium PH5-43]|nr:iron complex transport system substrate-binding protein [Dysgonomonadaceae bacterium PH5-43]
MRTSIGTIINVMLCLVLFASCNQRGNSTHNILKSNTDSIYYAKGFNIEQYDSCKIINLLNPWKQEQVLQTYILCPKSKPLPNNLPNGTVIRTPLNNTVSFTSVTCGFFDELDILSTLIGVAEPQYIDINYVKEGIKKGNIKDVGMASNPNIETLMLIEPEAIFTNPINDSGVSALNKVNSTIINCFEYMETNPLGQAEWIRFFGLLFEKESLADSLFFNTVNNYNKLKALIPDFENRPTVFAELKYGDFWYMPGGKSYMANLFADAGADYILKDSESSGSTSFSFETVLDKAENADFWLFKHYNNYDMTYQQLASDYSNYTLFKAYKNKNIYACNTLKRANYYIELPLHPDWILEDLIYIFHPELLPNYTTRYYIKLKE